jgi:hypothetical protein
MATYVIETRYIMVQNFLILSQNMSIYTKTSALIASAKDFIKKNNYEIYTWRYNSGAFALFKNIHFKYALCLNEVP